MAVDALTMTVLVLIYLAATLVIGYLGYRETKSTEDYLVAGRDSHPVDHCALVRCHVYLAHPRSSGSADRRRTSAWASSGSRC